VRRYVKLLLLDQFSLIYTSQPMQKRYELSHHGYFWCTFMRHNLKDEAVSEVIGTVLIIALVVTLAAIIGAMVFGLVGTVQDTKVIAVTAVRYNSSNISLTYNGGDRADQVYWLNISVNGTPVGRMGTLGGTSPVQVGNVTRIGGSFPGNDHVVVVAAFADGTEQVVLDTTV
jgi:flagellin-like protein